MSASATTVRRWAPKVQQSRRSPISLSASVRLSASALVNEVFPSGRKVDGVSACELSRARRDGGPLAKAARYLLAMSYEDRAKVLTWLRGIVRAYDRDDECVSEVLAQYRTADIEEELVEAAVWQDMGEAAIRVHLSAVRREHAASARLIAAYERLLAEGA